jgi:allantoin racemase
MRIWFQLFSSETGLKRFIAATQKLVDRAVAPGTKVEVRGTTNGVLGDQYRLFWNYDAREVIDNGLRIRKEGGYDAFVIANSLDPAIVELREMMDIPVISFMEVCCYTACMMGEQFGIIVPNRKMVPRYREVPIGYGLRDRMAAVEPIKFDDVRSLEDIFTDEKVADAMQQQVTEATRRLVARGADVVFCAGPMATMMAQRGIFQIDGVPLLDSYTLLAKTAEMMATMHKLTGVCVSRHSLYEAPPRELVQKVGKMYNVDVLRDG